MKQSITKKQWHELSRKAKGTWNDWCQERGYQPTGFRQTSTKNITIFINAPFIGQIIEFLITEGQYSLFIQTEDWVKLDCVGTHSKEYHSADWKDLCDLLWRATREVLER